MTSNTSGFTPSRRTLVKGAAWSVPVVAVAGAAPAFAASQEVWFNNLGIACKLPGASCESETGVKKGYVVAMQVCTNVRSTVTVDFGSAVGTLCGTEQTWNVSPDPLIVQPATEQNPTNCETVYLALDGEPNSQNCPISGSAPFTWSSESGLSGSGVMTFSAAATPPCDNCRPPAPGSTTDVQEDTTATEDLTVEESTVETQSVEQPAEVEAPAEVTETDTPGDDASQTAQPQG